MARLYTPFNGSGGESYTTDEEQLNARRGDSEAARAAAMAALAAQVQMHQADLTDRQSGRAQQGAQFDKGLAFEGSQAQAGRDFQGGMFDRQAGLSRELDQSGTDRAFGLADRANAAPLAQVQLERDKFGATDWRNQAARGMFEKWAATHGQGAGAGVPGAPGGGLAIDPQDENDLMMSIISGQPAQTRQQRELAALQLEEAKRGSARGRVEDYVKAGDIAAAEALAKQAGVAVNKPKFGDPDAELADLKTQAGTFGTKDASWGINDDPTMEDVRLLDAKANRAVELLVRDKGMQPEEAKRIVNIALQEILNPKRGMNTGWIDTLFQRRGITGGGAPSAPATAGGGMSLGDALSGSWK